MQGHCMFEILNSGFSYYSAFLEKLKGHITDNEQNRREWDLTIKTTKL